MTSLDVLHGAMPHQKSLTLINKEAEDFPRGDNHSRFVYIHVNIGKAFTCGENFNKKYRAAAKLISKH